jgi:putative ABC transport system permease protein
MRIPDYILTAQTNLLRTKARTFLTILAFVVGAFTLSMTTAFGQGLQTFVNTQLSAAEQTPNMVTITPSGNTPAATSSGVQIYTTPSHSTANDDAGVPVLTTSDLTRIKDTPGIQAVYPAYGTLAVDYIQYKSQPKYSFGDAISAFPGISWTLAAGAFPTAQQPNGVLLPYPYVEALGVNQAKDLVGQTATIHITNQTTNQSKDYTVLIAGILEDTQHVPAPVLAQPLADSIAQFEGESDTQFSGAIAVTSATAPTDALQTQIQNTLTNSGYSVETYQGMRAHYQKALDIITYGLGGFACIAILAASIGIINTLLMSVIERTQEVGLLKALGMRRRGITFIYLLEAASLGFWGGVGGVVLAKLAGLVLNPLLNRTLFSGVGRNILSYPFTYMAAIICGGLAIGLLAGTIPAIRAGKLDPIEALRRE